MVRVHVLSLYQLGGSLRTLNSLQYTHAPFLNCGWWLETRATFCTVQDVGLIKLERSLVVLKSNTDVSVPQTWRVEQPDMRKSVPLQALKGKSVICITTGCPRVGNDDFARGYADLVNKEQNHFESYRVMNNRDLVPAVPLNSWGFCHVGTPIWLFRKRNNWAYLQFTMVNKLPTVTETNEVTSRPYGYGISVRHLPVRLFVLLLLW